MSSKQEGEQRKGESEMEAAGLMEKLLVVCEWLTRLAYLNLLWMLFTFIGLIGAGLAPATVAMFSVVRKWTRNEETGPVFTAFWTVYKGEFFKANLLGGLFSVLIGVILVSGWMMSSVSLIFAGGAAGLMLLLAVVVLYVLPVYVHFEYTLLEMMKASFVLCASFPLQTILMISSAILAVIIAVAFPAVGFLFFGSALSFVVMKTANGVFMAIREKEQGEAAVINAV